MVRVSRVSRARVRVSLRIGVRFTFRDRVGIGLPTWSEWTYVSGSRRVGTAYVGVTMVTGVVFSIIVCPDNSSGSFKSPTIE